jgi:glucose-1-phosphate adenylyltransferase
MVSGGCIVSGSNVSNSVLFSSVRVHSFCQIDQAVLLPNTTIGRGCRISKVVVDRGCTLPEGLVIGDDPELDARRFERTSNGVVLVTSSMLSRLAKAPA